MGLFDQVHRNDDPEVLSPELASGETVSCPARCPRPSGSHCQVTNTGEPCDNSLDLKLRQRPATAADNMNVFVVRPAIEGASWELLPTSCSSLSLLLNGVARRQSLALATIWQPQ